MKSRDHSSPSPSFGWKPKRPAQTPEPKQPQLKLRIPLQKPRKEGK